MTYTALDRAQPTDSNRGARDRLYDLVCKKMGISKPLPYDDIVNEKDHLIDQAVVRKAVVIAISIALDTLSLYNDRENSATDAPSPDKEVSTPPNEGEPKKQGVEIVGLQASRTIRGCLQKVISSPDIPEEEKVEFINKATSHVVDVFEAHLKGITFEETLQQKAQTLQQKKGVIFSHRPKQEKAVQPPDLSKIPLWQGRKRGEMPLDYLKTHYGQYLSAFGAEQNSVFQDQIRAHDPKLVQGVINQLREEGKGRKVGEFVKTRSARVDRELENIDPEHLREAHRLKSADRRRRRKKADTKASSY